MQVSVDHRRQQRGRTSNQVWTPEAKTHALAIFAETLSATEASRQTGIPKSTITEWADNDEGQSLIDQLRLALRHRMAYKCAEVARDAMIALHDRVANGDYVQSKSGELIRIPLSGKDLAYIASMATDKHALLTGGIKDSKGINGGLLALADQLAKLGDKLPTPQVIDSIDVQAETPDG